MKKSHFQIEKGLSLSAFWQRYGSNENCREELFRWKWPDGYHCQKCGYEQYLKIEEGKAYQCRRCQHIVLINKDTFLLVDKLSLRAQFLIRYMVSQLKNFLSTPVTRPIYRPIFVLVRNTKKAFGVMYHVLVSDEYCAVNIPWTKRPRSWNNLEKLHWCYTRIRWEKNKLYCIVSAVVWPLKTLFFTLQRTMQFGPLVKKRTGIPKTRQFLDQIYLAIRYFIPPRAFYFYKLYESSNQKHATEYIHDHEIIVLNPFINSLRNKKLLDDKGEFYQECKKAGLATIPIVAEFDSGKIINQTVDIHGKLFKNDLFAKPNIGRQGLGTRLFTYQEDGRYRKDDGFLLTLDELLNHLLESSREVPYVLQQKIVNHPGISQLSTGALCTVRVVTCRRPKESPWPLISVFKMPTGMSLTDNMSTGALGSPVDEQKGILGAAISLNPAAKDVSLHPDTGHKIVGVILPFWQQVIQLSILAHKTFSDFSSIAWDIALTEEGPLLVEGNLTWGVGSLQRPHNLPLGRTCFPEIYLQDFNM